MGRNNSYDIKGKGRQENMSEKLRTCTLTAFYSKRTIRDPNKASSMCLLMQVLFHLTLTDDNTTGFKKMKFVPWGPG